MSKKICSILAVILCLSMVFSAAAAFDSIWDRYQGPVIVKDPDKLPGDGAPDPVLPTEEPVVIDIPAPDPVIPEVQPETKSERTIADGLHSAPEPKNEPEVIGPQSDPDPVIPAPYAEDIDSSAERSLTLNTISIYGSSDASVRSILDKLEGMSFTSKSQAGENPRSQFRITMQGKDVLTYDLQNGTPYYVSSNFLGSSTYMIYPEDEFEEKLVSAFYDLISKVSDDSSQLPPKEDVLAMIKTVRETLSNGSIQELQPTSLNLTQEVDPSALMGVMMSVMTRFVSADPTEGIGYRYTDLDNAALEYEWPDAAALPAVSEAVSATQGTFTGQDLLDLCDALPQFLADNPELADAINTVAVQAVQRTNPTAGIPDDADFLNELISSLKESAQKSPDTYVTLKIDNDQYGAPVLITVEIGKPENGVNTGGIITVQQVSDYPVNAIDIAVDAFQGDEKLPVLRLVNVNDNSSYNGTSRLNFAFNDPSTNRISFEIASDTQRYGGNNSAAMEEHTTVQFTFSEQRGNLKIDKLPAPNAFGGNDFTSLIAYEHSMGSQPLFGLTMTAEARSGEMLPELTPADAAAAADLTSADYEEAAGNIFLQLMNLIMMFM